MDRRQFLKTAAAASVVPFIPAPPSPVIGWDPAPGPDVTSYEIRYGGSWQAGKTLRVRAQGKVSTHYRICCAPEPFDISMVKA